MEISLEKTWWRWAIVLASLVVAATLIPQASILWLAHDRLNSENLARMERGEKLTPGDAAGWDRVGRLHQWDFVNSNLPEAISDYQRAVQDEPRSANYWMDLAGAYEAAGDQARASDAFTRAKAVYPASAVVAFNYGNFLLRQGKPEQGFRELRKAVSTDPQLLPLAISRSWRASGDVNQILAELLPPNMEAYSEAVDFFASSGHADEAMIVWKRLVGLPQRLDLSRAFPFLDQLLHDDRGDDASVVWQEALAAAGLPHDAPANGSLIRNGDFAKDFSNGGLDWRWVDVLGAYFGFDTAPSGGGSRAVRLDFSGGSNIDLRAPAQFVPVEPGRLYHFRALMRTDGITTESGIEFFIFDPNHADGVRVATENFTGTHDWTPVAAEVSTSPKTHVLVIELTRRTSRLFENKLGGTVWIADVTLVPLKPTRQPAP